MSAYKFTRRGGRALFSDFGWPLPSDSGAGAWVEVPGPLEACRHGLHLCRIQDLPYWVADELFEVEIEGQPLMAASALVAARARLVRRVESWNASSQLEFGRACVARAHASLESHAEPGLHRASATAYLEEATRFAANGGYTVAAYASALARAALDPSEQMNIAFHLERSQQGVLLGQLLGLPEA